MPNLIDDVTGNQDISDHFASKYESLYNSVSYDEADMKSHMKRLDCIIDNYFEIDINGKSNSVITVHDVEGISQVKHNKKDENGVACTCNDRILLSICMGHSGGDRYFVCIVHSRWNEVA